MGPVDRIAVPSEKARFQRVASTVDHSGMCEAAAFQRKSQS